MPRRVDISPAGGYRPVAHLTRRQWQWIHGCFVTFLLNPAGDDRQRRRRDRMASTPGDRQCDTCRQATWYTRKPLRCQRRVSRVADAMLDDPRTLRVWPGEKGILSSTPERGAGQHKSFILMRFRPKKKRCPAVRRNNLYFHRNTRCV
jgi:hypothetical protein